MAKPKILIKQKRRTQFDKRVLRFFYAVFVWAANCTIPSADFIFFPV